MTKNLFIKKYLLATSAITIASLITALPAFAAVGQFETPTNGSVVGGTAAITLSGADNRNMDVTQTTDRGVINWDTFNIGIDAKTQFNQPTSGAMTINRIVGPQSDPSQILGALKSNGRIMILDRNGVLFGANSVIDAGGIIASTGNLDSANQAVFLGGGNVFVLSDVDANPDKKIDNHSASFNVKDSGLLAFVAPYVYNSGNITAKLGKVTLASGKKVTIDLTGDDLVQIALDDKLGNGLIENSGSIIAAGGTVVMSANAAKTVVDNVINMTGIVKADSFGVSRGVITLSGGEGGKVRVAGTLQADKKSSGSAGNISINGHKIETANAAVLSVSGASSGPDSGLISFSSDAGGSVDLAGGKFSGKQFNIGASTVNLTDGIHLSDANLFVDADKVNLGAGIFNSSSSLILDVSRISGTAPDVNILSGNAAIQQGINIAGSGATVTVNDDDYFENLTIGKPLVLQGDGSYPYIYGTKPAGKIITVLSDDVTVQGLTLDGSDGSGSDYGIFAKAAANLNIFDNYIGNLLKDGIHIEKGGNLDITGNYIGNTGQDGIQLDSVTSATIGGNNIAGTTENGIQLDDSSGIEVSGNTLLFIGEDGVDADGTPDIKITGNHLYLTIGDGFQVSNSDGASISDNDIHGAGNDGVHAYDSNKLSITGNTVSGEGVYYGAYRDGIFVNNTSGSDISGNNVLGSLYDGSHGAGRDGIHAEDIHESSISGNTISVTDGDDEDGYSAGRDGILLRNATHVVASGNKVDNYQDDGVQIYNSDTVTISGSKIDGGAYSGTTGIRLGNNNGYGYKTYAGGDPSLSGSDNVIISGNTVGNNDNAGVYAMAFDNGGIAISGNAFTDNAVGTWIGSGAIDLTGDANIFNGGDVAMRFSLASIRDGEDGTDYADLSLINDTIGATEFSHQSAFYVELLNGAFFAPSTPTIIDGTFAAYDGVNGGVLTQVQLDDIEAKINDYDDDDTLGEIFAGSLTGEIDDSLLFRRIAGNNYGPGHAGVFITGLPDTGEGDQGGGSNGLSAEDLANLAPAAGGDDNGGGNSGTDYLASLEPAAGGNGNGVSSAQCWSQAIGAMNGKNAVYLDLGGDQNDVLNSSAVCQGGGETF